MRTKETSESLPPGPDAEDGECATIARAQCERTGGRAGQRRQRDQRTREWIAGFFIQHHALYDSGVDGNRERVNEDEGGGRKPH